MARNPRYVAGTAEFRAYQRERTNRWNAEHPERAREIWAKSRAKNATRKGGETQ